VGVALFTRLGDSELDEIAGAFELGAVHGARPIHAGTINSNFAVHTARGAWFVRVNEGKAETDVAWEAQLVAALAAGGVVTPPPVPARDGRPYAPLGGTGKWVSVFPWRDGRHLDPDEVTPQAADALGESKLPDGLDTLIELAQKPVTKKLFAAQVAAIHAIGKYTEESPKAAGALTKIIDKDPPPSPRTAKEKDQARALDEKYSLFLGVTGAAINALGDLHVAASAKTLVLSIFRTPELFTQIRRALVASGVGGGLLLPRGRLLRGLLVGGRAVVGHQDSISIGVGFCATCGWSGPA